MKRISFVVLALSLAVLAATTFAGEGPCPAGTQECLTKMAAKMAAKGWLGVDTEKLESGFYAVAAVDWDSPAQAAGFRKGDVLVALNGIKIHADNKEALVEVKKSLSPGSAVTYTVKRQGGKQQLAVTLGSVPEAKVAQWIGHHMIQHHAGEMIAAVE